MIKLQDTVIPIRYDSDDITSKEALISDIAETLKEKLTVEIQNKPFKCNVVLIYSSAYDVNDNEGMG